MKIKTKTLLMSNYKDYDAYEAAIDRYQDRGWDVALEKSSFGKRYYCWCILYMEIFDD